MLWKNWLMLLAVRISSYGCTREVWRALKKLETPRATLPLLSCSPNFPRASITRYTHAKHELILKSTKTSHVTEKNWKLEIETGIFPDNVLVRLAVVKWQNRSSRSASCCCVIVFNLQQYLSHLQISRVSFNLFVLLLTGKKLTTLSYFNFSVSIIVYQNHQKRCVMRLMAHCSREFFSNANFI